ncbi:hypothetical protein AOQ84DRAFT_411066 [Glonium stellatum]|uniref:Ipa protein n=1 Tax=Glonium stellatum TaxID=574774 RepID=A0A8E2EXM0_9PEZI|nr:hypothetical protein AOQ84DRAFT_411066 [Glonium stellatum]
MNSIIERYEATIQKRWIKKTKEQRKILLAAWPQMSTSHRPDFAAFKTKTAGQTGNSRRDAYIWPCVNLEDFLKSKQLFLLFLNSRGRNKPDAFAHADLRACRFGLTSCALVPAFLNEHVMMFTRRHTPETYGELIAWDDHPEAFQWLRSQRGAHPGEGLSILSIRERLYGFLVGCCKTILHEISEDTLIDPNVSIQPETRSVSGNETGLVLLATTAAEAPYRLPANLDLNRLESLIAAKLSAAEDHVWALREDPGYFAETLLDWKEHRQECLPDTLDRKHPAFSNSLQERIFWEHVIGNPIVSALVMVEMWGSTHEQIVTLQLLKEKYVDSVSSDKDLPEEYALAFYKLHHHLQQFSKGPIGALKAGLSHPHPTNTKIQVTKRTSIPKDQSRDELVWIFMTLFDEQQLHLAVTNQISDLSVFSQCLYQIELYQPWAATFATEMAAKEDEIKKEYLETEKSFEPYFRTRFGGLITSLGTPTGNIFRYPVYKRRTQDNIEAMIQAEGHLDSFWRAVDQELASNGAISSRLQKLLSQRMLQRTPEWVEPAKAPKTRVSASDITSISREKTSMSKTKVRTRGLAQLASTSSEAEPLDQYRPDAQPTFMVDNRALKAFKTIFFTPSASSQPGEVAWGDFLHAMSSIGFTAEKLYGSVWQFTPTKLDVERSIQFHEPHPCGKIPFTIARRYGRRLDRAYGWHGGMFVLG